MHPEMTLEQMLAGFIFVAHGSRVVWMPEYGGNAQTLKRASYRMTDLERYFALNPALAQWLKHPKRLSAANFQEAEKVLRQVQLEGWAQPRHSAAHSTEQH